jgi:hypothetical protein
MLLTSRSAFSQLACLDKGLEGPGLFHKLRRAAFFVLHYKEGKTWGPPGHVQGDRIFLWKSREEEIHSGEHQSIKMPTNVQTHS